MSREKEIIEMIHRHMPRSSSQENQLFESDSEIINVHGNRILFSMDDFSAEDLMRESDPYRLGWNMAAGSISDILASGGKPKFYAHSLVMQDSWSQDYVEKLTLGIAQVLREYGTAFMGGDLGISQSWRYTASVIGDLDGPPLLRSGANVGEGIYLSGRVGKGNVEAGLTLFGGNAFTKSLTDPWKNYFCLRSREAELINRYCRCCIDTSDGVFNALRAISEMSGTGFLVGGLPYAKGGLLLAKALKLPKELLFLGECGEYELLFTLAKDAENEFLRAAREQNLTFYRLGEVRKAGIQVLRGENREWDLSNYSLQARDYADPKDYLRKVIEYLTAPARFI
ncbi:thiamine monophosphate kinase [Desulfosporosinus orientis DSM 765]|uniref:Thiamine monophosphate kinase n=1 Tax=Desulfosporosinus orientis (strain ATCC 19365 / DSM 765 / NCIMB 8382 / VKM B-1628 / Singapore I) TaxID=768706 RepID=G7WF63_DESOD|nr:AIR synthase related protein [Desulfosporosinus orientis]AET67674.1 thiamine monophosphate kinase [Desulfosporosinus orientis DSM 765]